MSLRVLLADESPSIKKAFELALQDYGIKVQTVHQGVDVQELYNSFKPDICFMDILLPKLNGYEACLQLKLEEESKNTPVVLMWSGFMELDQDKYKSSKADGSIEKPFETDNLRGMVKKLVSRLGQNELSDHLVIDTAVFENESNYGTNDEPPELKIDASNTPGLPPLDTIDFDDDEDENTPPLGTEVDVSASSPEEEIPAIPDFDSILNEDSDLENDLDDDIFAAPDGFDLGGDLEDSDGLSADEDWSEQSLDNDSLEVSTEGLDDVDAFSMTPLNDTDLPFETEPLEDDNFTAPEGFDLPPTPNSPEGFEADEATQNIIAPLKPEPGQESHSENLEPLKTEEVEQAQNIKVPQLSKEELKRLILAQSKDIIESVVWDVVPELAKEMIQKEIQRLTGEIKYEGDLR